MKPKFLLPFIVFYLLILVAEIFAEHHHVITNNFNFLGIMQPMLVPGLIIYLIYNCKGRWDGFSMGMLVGLSFDWIGDVILTLYMDSFNLLSMLGYFAGHVCYAIAFSFSIKKSGYKVSFINRFIFSLPPIFYIFVYYLFMYNYMSNHHINNTYIIPSTLYAVSILSMAIMALWRMGTTTDGSYWCITTGALFYMLSDSITGYNHFVELMQYKYIATMFTYGIALLLFVIGTIIHKSANTASQELIYPSYNSKN